MRVLEVAYVDVPDNALVLIPIGSLEQHGPHLPLGTDTLVAQYVAGEVEKAFPDRVLLYPPIVITASMEHVGFRGTTYVDYETLMHYVLDVMSSISQWNRGGIVLVNGHGGNVDVLNLVVKKWNYKGNKPRALHYYVYNKRIINEVSKYFQRFGHADSVEASLVAYINRELVKWDRVVTMNNWGDINTRRTMEVSPQGVVGNLSKETIKPELGAQILRTMVNDLIMQLMNEFPEVMRR